MGLNPELGLNLEFLSTSNMVSNGVHQKNGLLTRELGVESQSGLSVQLTMYVCEAIVKSLRQNCIGPW